jgi:hypothetical protein
VDLGKPANNAKNRSRPCLVRRAEHCVVARSLLINTDILVVRASPCPARRYHHFRKVFVAITLASHRDRLMKCSLEHNAAGKRMRNHIARLVPMWMALFCLLASPRSLLAQAAPIRIATWDLKPKNGANNGAQNVFQEVVDSLKKLHPDVVQRRPDVILLQNVRDWQTCRQIAQALRPEVYQVVICTSFGDRASETKTGQVAILSRSKAYIAWSESADGEGGGGFAFAAMRLGDKNVGIFCVASAKDLGPQIVKQISALQSWKDNRPEGFIIVGRIQSDNPALEQIGFDNASVHGSPTAFFSRDAGSVPTPVAVRMPEFEYPLEICDIDLDGPKIARAPLPVPRTSAVTSTPAPNNSNYFWLAGLIAGLLAVFAVTRWFSRRSVALKTPPAASAVATRPQGPPYVRIETEGSSQTHSQSARLSPAVIPVTPRIPQEIHAGVVAHLSQWLKQKLVRQLVADRSQLLATQHAATLKMLEVDERLAKVERQVQQSQQDYERRIDDLTKELLAAREENRELIRAKIELVKVEMEDARLKATQRSPQRQPH